MWKWTLVVLFLTLTSCVTTEQELREDPGAGKWIKVTPPPGQRHSVCFVYYKSMVGDDNLTGVACFPKEY